MMRFSARLCLTIFAALTAFYFAMVLFELSYSLVKQTLVLAAMGAASALCILGAVGMMVTKIWK